jgi:hypothetical protein
MPAPTVVKRRIPTPPVGETQPLTVDASEEIAPETAPVEEEAASLAPEVAAELAKIAAPVSALTENADGSITIKLEHLPDTKRFNIPPLESITLKRALWKYRRAAARRYPANATNVDQDTCLIAELSGLPEHVIDELDSTDMSNVQMALGKLLYSKQMLSGV